MESNISNGKQQKRLKQRQQKCTGTLTTPVEKNRNRLKMRSIISVCHLHLMYALMRMKSAFIISVMRMAYVQKVERIERTSVRSLSLLATVFLRIAKN